MVKKTVGAGGDYADWSAAWIYLLSIDPLADDYEFEQISDCTINNTWPLYGSAELFLNHHYVKFYCPFALSHKGDPTAGYKTYCSGVNGRIWMLTNVYVHNHTTDKFSVSGLNIIQTSNNDVQLLRVGCGISGLGDSITAQITNVLIKGFSTSVSIGLNLQQMHTLYLVNNCKIYNCKCGIYAFESGGGGIPLPDPLVRSQIENVSLINTGVSRGIYFRVAPNNNRAFNWRNIVSCQNSVNLAFSTVASNAHNALYNCADDDGSIAALVAGGFVNAINCLGNRIPANEFQSLDGANSKFLFLKDGSIDLSMSRTPPGNLVTKQKCKFIPSLAFNPNTCTIGIAGIAPTYAGLLDIEGKPRPGGDDLYSIGCHEQQYV